MANGKYINIDFPFKESPQGFYVNLNADTQKAIKADLMHLLLTRKGQRIYNPDFGTNLMKYIFEPNDSLTLESVKNEVNASVNKYLPKLKVINLSVTQSTTNEYVATIRIDYVITEDVFEILDYAIINV
jgi:phage baseplate assembly protein W